MYDAMADPACYAGTTVLKNIPGHRSQRALDRFEAVATARRFNQPMPAGRWTVRHYQAVHRHIFQDVYRWAGRFRTIRISKGQSTFCYPENIPGQLRGIFAALRQVRHLRGLAPADFAAGAAHFMADLNACHAFRDGNGRAQLAFLALLAEQAGHPFDMDQLDPAPYLAAMIDSFNGNERPLQQQIRRLMGPTR